MLERAERYAQAVDRAVGLPRWAWAPVALGALDLLGAAWGYYWDVSWHIEEGRDESVFTAPHLLILLGLAGVAATGLTAHRMFVRAGAPGGIRIGPWTTAPGAALLVVCGGFAILGFPLDDLWHRFFGEDVTAWGPTHLLMISGAALSPVALAMLLAHGRATQGGSRSPLVKVLGIVVASAMLVGLSAYQVEFDFGVPQFQLLYHPVLIAIAAGLVLVAVRTVLGAGAALGAVVGYVAIRGALDLALLALGRAPARFPLYLAAALIVEAVARIWRRRPVAASVAAGVGIGTVGLLAETLVVQLWGYHPWTGRVVTLGLVLGSVGAVAAAVVGRAIASWLSPELPGPPLRLVAGAAVPLVAVLLIPLPRNAADPPQVAVALSPDPAHASPDRTVWVDATVDLTPASAAERADWFEAMAWQGGGQVVAPVERRGDRFATSRKIPIGGEWKTLLRYAHGAQIVATPLYLPADPDIGAAGFPSRGTVEATLELDSKLLLREARGGPAWALAVGYGTVLTAAAVWIALIFWGLIRLGRVVRSVPKGGGASVSAARPGPS